MSEAAWTSPSAGREAEPVGGASPSSSIALGGLVAIDQATFAGAHFFSSFLLARWLAPAEYGTFAQANALLLVGLALHSAFVTEPLLVHGRGRFAQRFERYLGAILGGHFALSLAFAAALLGALAAAGEHGALRRAGLALAWGAPALLLVPLLRRACCVRSAWGTAAAGGLLYALSLGTSLWLARGTGILSVGAALAALALASLLASSWMGLRLRTKPSMSIGGGFAREVARAHWEYGRFALLAILATWIPWNLHYLILDGVLDLEEIGALRALHNLLLPPAHLSMALCTALLPLLAAHLRAGRRARARALMLRHAAAVAAMNAVYVGALAVCGERALSILYGSSFAAVHSLAPWAAAIQAPWSVIAALALVQMAAGRSDRALLLWLPCALLSLVLGTGGAAWSGVEGFILGILVASSASLPLAWLGHRHWSPVRQESRP